MIIYKPGQDIILSTAAFILNPISNNRDKDSFHFLGNQKLYQEFYTKTNPRGGDVLWYRPEQKNILEGERGIINICIKESQSKNRLSNWVTGIKKIVKQVKDNYPDGLYPAPLLAISISNKDLDEGELLKAITNSLMEIKFDVEIYTSKLPNTSEPIKEISEPK